MKHECAYLVEKMKRNIFLAEDVKDDIEGKSQSSKKHYEFMSSIYQRNERR